MNLVESLLKSMFSMAGGLPFFSLFFFFFSQNKYIFKACVCKGAFHSSSWSLFCIARQFSSQLKNPVKQQILPQVEVSISSIKQTSESVEKQGKKLTNI